MTIIAAGCREVCPILDIEGGQVQGVSTDISGVYVFRGIPYAAPPIHGLRWKAPQPVIPWNDLSEFHQAEQKSKTIMDRAGYTSSDKMRNASTLLSRAMYPQKALTKPLWTELWPTYPI